MSYYRHGDRKVVTNPKDAEVNQAKGRHRMFYEAESRRNRVIELVSSGALVKDAVAAVGVNYDTYKHWRIRFPNFAARLDLARADQLGNDISRLGGSGGFDFAVERKHWFGHDTPDFQLEVTTAMENLAPGDILLVLLPPEHGKTTMFEDYACLKLAHDPSWRSHVGSESIALSKKVLGRVMDRLNPAPGSPLQSFVARFGPFAPPAGQGGDRHRQPWQESYFDVWRKLHDERDYSMAALGFGSQIIGSRSDHLHCDDLQSIKTLTQTDKNFEKWRQDWLTRPGESGWTSVMGNRVDEGDIYEAIIEEIDPDILHVIRYPAIRSNGEPLWPQRWDLRKLDRMKRKVGEAAWERNWQQRPRPKGHRTFTAEILDECLDPLIPVEQTNGLEGRIVYIGLDPGLDPGTTALCAIAMKDSRPGFDVVAVRKHERLQSNEQIMARLHVLANDMVNRGAHVTDIVIESKNFQAGLCRDERLLALRDRYGWTISEHLTGWNKYDENIGVPSMVTSFIKQDITLPWADDETTRHAVGELRSELLAWRPFVKGTKLRQDLVMALWFAWIRWRVRKGQDATPDHNGSEAWRTKALPYAATRTGLILPRGAYPSVLSGMS